MPSSRLHSTLTLSLSLKGRGESGRRRGRLRHKVRPGVALVLALATAAGCVHRELVIRSEPTDALVILDDTEIGRSPATTAFTFYGTRKVTLKKEGYATTVRFAEVKPPWYEWFPLDFASEILWPGRIVDRHEFTFALEKPRPVDEGALLDRAEELRRQVTEP